MAMFLSIIFCLFLLAIYFAPSFIAIGRKHQYVLQITLLNALLGWSFFGWAVALIWATTNHVQESINTKMSWVIISIFALAVVCPILFFWGLFGLYVPGNIEIKNPQNVEKIEYHGYFYKLNPDNDSKKDDTDKDQNKKEIKDDKDQ